MFLKSVFVGDVLDHPRYGSGTIKRLVRSVHPYAVIDFSGRALCVSMRAVQGLLRGDQHVS